MSSNAEIIKINGKNSDTNEVVLDTRGMMDLPFLMLTLLLLAIGLVMMFSASYASSYSESGDATHYFFRQLVFAIAGVAVMFIVSKVNYQTFRVLSIPLFVVAVITMALVPLIGDEGGGARRWIDLGFIRFQPSEIAKLSIILTFASMMSVYKEKMKTFRFGIAPFAAILVLYAILLALEPHYSALVIFLALGASMMFLGGVRLRYFIVGIGVAAAAAVLVYNTVPYVQERIISFMDPFQDPTGDGYQVIQSLYAIGSGGLLGLGLGRSRQKYLYLPEEHNDFIFAIVCEELGMVGAVAVILLFMLLIIRGYWLAMHARDRFGSLVIAGITTLLALQVFFNVAVVTNVMPPTGISLPFFSYGGTALMLQLFEMGIVLSVSRQNMGKRLG